MKKSRDHAEYLNQKMTATLETELQKVSQQFKDCDGVIEKNMAKLAKEVKRCEAVNTRVQKEFQSMSDTLEREGLRIETAEASLKQNLTMANEADDDLAKKIAAIEA